ncbi:MAG: hypothetical protein WA667_20945 [Candidatus Nitrosopolaris sp.]
MQHVINNNDINLDTSLICEIGDFGDEIIDSNLLWAEILKSMSVIKHLPNSSSGINIISRVSKFGLFLCLMSS